MSTPPAGRLAPRPPGRLAPRPTGRLAPSPTGHLHVGHARSFLLAWWSARARGGRVVLRLEDLDAARARPELVDDCLADLEWLGLDWDAGPHRQSEDVGPYAAAVAELLAAGRAYPCVCTRREIQASAPHRGDGEVRYPGTCRDRFATVEEAEAASGRSAGIRLRVPGGPLTIQDELGGAVAHDVQAEVGDFMLARRDGVYSYQLAVVVDDAAQGVDEVVRGDDLLPSAVRQAHLQAALGLPRPRWFHVPLVVDPGGERLAKRRADLALTHLRGTLPGPGPLLAWVARSVGLDPDAGATAADFVEAFAWERLPRGPVPFEPSVL